MLKEKKKTKTVERTETPEILRERKTGAALPAIVGPNGVIEPDIIEARRIDSIRISVIGGEVADLSVEGGKTLRELCRDPKTGLQEDMEFFVNGVDATLDTIVRNGDAVVGLDRFDAGVAVCAPN